MVHIKNHINTLIYMAPAVEYELPASLDIYTKHCLANNNILHKCK